MVWLVLLVSLLFGSCQAEKKLSGSWSLCTGDDLTECPSKKYTDISTVILPTTIPVAENFTVIVVADSLVKISDPSISIATTDETLINTIIEDEGCHPHKYIFPLSDGVIYYDGLTPNCPISTGALNVTFTATISSLGWSNPDGTGVVTFKLYDEPNQAGNCALCVVTSFTMTGK